ncbi:MAG: TonB-dependent receptor [Candidatus Kapaibacterium sp.]
MKTLLYQSSVALLCLIMAGSVSFAGTNFSIKGKVKNAEGKPVAGASVRIDKTVLGDVADKNGEFEIKNVPAGRQILQITSVGFTRFIDTVKSEEIFDAELEVTLLESVSQTEEVVITGTRTEKLYDDVPVKISVVDDLVFSSTATGSLKEGIRFQPGLRIENTCQNCGVNSIRLNGLDGQYSQVLINSRPVFSSLLSVYGLEQIPANMIDRVEVVRGGGSSLYGPSAVSGVVNIITKEPSQNTFQASYKNSFVGGTANDGIIQISSTIVDSEQKYGLFLYGLHREREHYDANDDGFSEIAELTVNTFGGKMFYKPDHISKFTLDVSTVFDDRRGGDAFDLQPHQANISEAAAHKTYSGGINYERFINEGKNKINAYASYQATIRDSYYGAGQDINAYGTTDNNTLAAGALYSHVIENLAGGHVITMGYEYTADHIEDNYPAYDRFIDQESISHGFYLQDDWDFSKFCLLYGGRVDKHNKIEDVIFSPRVNLLYKMNSRINLRSSYSTGFRAPQAFDEDLHIGFVNAEPYYITVGEGLRPEYSKSLTFSADWSNNLFGLPLSISAEYFYTRLEDVFVDVEIDATTEGTILERRNGEGATVSGTTLEMKAMLSDKFSLMSGFTYQQGIYDSPEAWSEDAPASENILRSPDWYGYMNASYKANEKLLLDISAVLTGPMYVPHYAGGLDPQGNVVASDVLERSGTFLDLDAKVTYRIYSAPNISMTLGVLNFLNSYQDDFDKGMNRDAGYIYGPDLPRTYYIGIKTEM